MADQHEEGDRVRVVKRKLVDARGVRIDELPELPAPPVTNAPPSTEEPREPEVRVHSRAATKIGGSNAPTHLADLTIPPPAAPPADAAPPEDPAMAPTTPPGKPTESDGMEFEPPTSGSPLPLEVPRRPRQPTGPGLSWSPVTQGVVMIAPGAQTQAIQAAQLPAKAAELENRRLGRKRINRWATIALAVFCFVALVAIVAYVKYLSTRPQL